MHKTARLILSLFLLGIAIPALSQSGHTVDKKTVWVDSVMGTLTLQEKIGQLFMLRANQPGGEYDKKIGRYIREYNLGGVTFFGGEPFAQLNQTDQWQKISKIPMLISIDGEWGLGMRLDSTISYPFQMSLGAVDDTLLIYRMGLEIGRQCKRMGIHINFAPVVDINSNAMNPVIHMRSFGEDREQVTKRALAYMRGMKDAGIMAVAKHFPGHGDTGTDSHKTLPVLDHPESRLDSIELYPYREMIPKGLQGIMIAHLSVPALESSENLPSTLSPSIVTGLLREELGFQGLVFTDALDMKGVTNSFKTGEIEVRALEAGNDILLLSEDLPKAIKAIMQAIESGRLKEGLIDQRCRKVLSLKYDLGLSEYHEANTENLFRDLYGTPAESINRELFSASVTLLRNENDIIPVKGLDTLKIASVVFGKKAITEFQEAISRYAPATHFSFGYDMDDDTWGLVREQLRGFNLVIMAFQGTSIWNTQNFGIPERFWNYAEELSLSSHVILDLFTSPYALNMTGDFPGFEAIIMSYQDHPLAGEIAAQAIFGGVPFAGRLPVTAGGYPGGSGLETTPSRLAYSTPESIGIKSEYLTSVDSLVETSIRLGVFPGCQVLAAKDGVVFYEKSFGYHTYEKEIPVWNDHLYDIASITKVAATTLSVMSMSESGMLDIDRELGDYLPFLRGTDKEDIIIREMLAHQSRFLAWIPYFEYTLLKGDPDPEIYSNRISEEYPTRVAEEMYIRRNYKYAIFDSIRFSKLREENSYLYSDLGFYMLKEIMELRSNIPFEDYCRDHFYKPLGLQRTGFLPRNTWSTEEIVPTENDRVYRQQLLHGDVHDQGAAMLGGVSGHAGLFSDANGLAVIMQMLLNGGIYGGEKYFDPVTVREFTSLQFPINENRRGIGFDKPLIQYEEDGPNCRSASPKSFGHSGFTGTYFWADPENDLIYVFLSNRVHPDARNNKISELNIRTTLHQMFYDAIEKSNKTKYEEYE